MAEASAERYLGKLISFVKTAKEGKQLWVDPWDAFIGEVITVHGHIFQLLPCGYDQPHKPLCEATHWFDVQKIHDVKVVQRIG